MIITHRVQLFGHVALERIDQPPWRFPTRKARALLGYLIRHAHPVSRSEITNLLWGDLSDVRGRRNLTRELSQLAATLPHCFQTDYHTIHWTPPPSISVDTAAFSAALAASDTPSIHASTLPLRVPSDAWFDRPGAATIDPLRLAAAVALYGGEFMAGLYLDGCPDFETWLTREREFWRRQVLEHLELLIAYHALHHQDAQAITFARRCLELEPWHEESHRALMILLTRMGQRTAALAQYTACQRLLADELGVTPTDATTALYKQLRAGTLDGVSPGAERRVGDPRMPGAIAPIDRPTPPQAAPRAQSHGSGVPEVHRFFGREAEITLLRQWVEDAHARVIAVLGMGGVGKTALVARLAQLVRAHVDVVIWRSLLNAPPIETILRELITAIIDTRTADIPQDLDQQFALLLMFLRQRRCLIVLDNVESLFQAGARAGVFRADCAAYAQLLRVLAEQPHHSCLLLTSREQPQGSPSSKPIPHMFNRCGSPG